MQESEIDNYIASIFPPCTKIIQPDQLVVYDKTYFALKYLYESSIYVQNQFNRRDLVNSESEWGREFCTIRFQSPRRTGKSIAIARLIGEYSRQKWVVINSTLQQCDIMRGMIRSHSGLVLERASQREYNWIGGKAIFGSFNQLVNNPYMILDFSERIDSIILDNASFYELDELEKIYEIGLNWMHGNANKFFVLVG